MLTQNNKSGKGAISETKKSTFERNSLRFVLLQLSRFFNDIRLNFDKISKRNEIIKDLNKENLEILFNFVNQRRGSILERYAMGENNKFYYSYEPFDIFKKQINDSSQIKHSMILELRKIKNDFSKKSKAEQLILLKFLLGNDVVKFEYEEIIEVEYDRSMVTVYREISESEYNDDVDFLSSSIDSIERLELIIDKYPKLITMEELEVLERYQKERQIKFIL